MQFACHLTQHPDNADNLNTLKPHRSQPVFPATVLAAAVMLSITSATDVTIAAVLMNAGRQVPARALADAESLGQWLSRFADAARQMRDVFAGDEQGVGSAQPASVLASRIELELRRGIIVKPSQQFYFDHVSPIPLALTDLPPPIC